jgi:hypothetical protein
VVFGGRYEPGRRKTMMWVKNGRAMNENMYWFGTWGSGIEAGPGSVRHRRPGIRRPNIVDIGW